MTDGSNRNPTRQPAAEADTDSGELFLGLDIGSVNARAAVVDGAGRVVYLDRERIYKGPASAVAALLERLEARIPPDRIAGAGATGSGRQVYHGQRGWRLFSSPYSAITGLAGEEPAPRTIVEVGGQSALVIGLSDGTDRSWRVARSPLCAAGTGRFLEQQASRLGIQLEQFGATALTWNEAPPRIAARCSVFAKSDLIHLQQKGWPISAMLAGLSDSIARMIVAQWRDSFWPPIYCLGGVAANQGVVRALSAVLHERVIVPPRHDSRGAIGAALLARRSSVRPAALYPPLERDGEIYYLQRRLETSCSTNGWKPADLDGKVVEAYLGVDVGSTSTKAAVISPEGEVLAKHYLMTAGQPLEAIKQVMANLAPQVEERVRVKGVGVTGSGRYLVGNFIGADLIKNEITAQTRAALQIDPLVDTIFELGGQDSKYVYLENGTALDYQMNKACAAGTGSFVDELAEQLGVSTRTGEFARLAFDAGAQLDLGEKCTAFMSQAVTSAQHAGASMEVIVSSLSTSLAKNYRSKVVGSRKVGGHIFLTGAVFYNEAVVSAFRAEFPGKTLVVPEHKEVTGAIGAALLAKESMPRGVASSFKGFSAVAGAGYRLTNFNCQRCENNCAISVMRSGSGEKVYYGSRCDLFDAIGRKNDPVGGELASPRPANTLLQPADAGHRSPADAESGNAAPGSPSITHHSSLITHHPRLRRAETPFDEREALLLEGYDPSAGTGALVGVPRALMSYDLAPMLTGFLNALGVRVRYSSPTNKKLIEKSLERAYTDSCFPIKLLHGHVAELLEEGAEFVLIPNAIRMGEKAGDEDQRYSCPLVQAAPYIIRSVFGLEGPGDGIAPGAPSPKPQHTVTPIQSVIPAEAGIHRPGAPSPSSASPGRRLPTEAGEAACPGRGEASSPPTPLGGVPPVEAACSGPAGHGCPPYGTRDGARPKDSLSLSKGEGLGEGSSRGGGRQAPPPREDVPASPPRAGEGPGERSVTTLLDPVIDLSRGEDLTLRSFAEVAHRMGFSEKEGLRAAGEGLAAQSRFEARLTEAGHRVLARLESDPEAIGVVLMSRAYNAQDAGANLGMAQELQKLGVVPIPLDYLPLESVNVREISDRPYWNYERKLLAAARLIAENPQLFGLFLSNFGCGPNSIIQNIVEDIMGGKPLGQIEVDEHAAEAGYITRLEALVETIRGYRRAGLRLSGDPAKYARRVPSSVRSGEHVLLVRMSDHAEILAAAMRSFGVKARVLPESDDRSMALSRDVTNGKECLPFRDSLGVLLRMAVDGELPESGRALMAGSFGPCRLGKYAQEQQKILDQQGIALEVMTTVSNNAYSDLGLGTSFELLAWQGIVAVDHLQKLLWGVRPYERRAGEANRLYDEYVARLSAAVEAHRPIDKLMREAAIAFLELRDPSMPPRPKVGINGEIYLRANRFCNQELVATCEANGLEAEVAPMSEWLKYVTLRNVEDAMLNREFGRLLRGAVRRLFLGRYEGRVASWFGGAVHEREPDTQELLRASSLYLPARNGSEAVLSLGSGVRQMADPHFAGVISVMPHGCMPGGIVAAFAEQISRRHGYKPWISLTYDGFEDKVNPERIADLAEQLKHREGRA